MAVPSPAPWPRRRSGRISELYTQARGPSPTEKATTNATTAATLTVATAASSLAPANAANREPRTSRDAVMPPVLARRSGRRPTLSASALAMRMEPALATPKRTLRLRSRVLEVTPAMASTRGPYSTTESMPDDCWKNCSVSTMTSTRRTPALVATSFQAPPPLRPPLLTTSSISSSRCSASAGVSEVLSSARSWPRRACPSWRATAATPAW
ncbi:hypothetical protein PVAP13_3NG231163 [Panicum virgatum]|uniref:Uncharacterized protein n=1 Tax=Panicum virgatum TaxID=38727 RepID=A0A8T0UEP5_PANVG|nr:hypothetical protein PVAP13_3NG231163 [Panicum virgatum]